MCIFIEVMVVKVGAEGTVFENSPKMTRADVRHELVPEIRVASKILNQPETAEKLREVSQKLKTEDGKIRGRMLTNRGWVNTPIPDDRMALNADSAFIAEKYSGSPLRLRRDVVEAAAEHERLLDPRKESWKANVKKLLCCCW